MNLSDLKQKMVHGSVAGLVRIALAVPVYLLLTPMVLHALGPEQYGIWAFSTIVINLMNVTDFGLKNSLVYHVARHAQRPDEAQQYFSVTLWSYLIIAALLIVGTALWGERMFPVLLNVPESLHASASFVLWVTIVGLGWRLLALPYQAVIEGYQELAWSQLIFLSWLLVHFAGTLLALAVAPTVYGLGWAALIGNIFIFAAFFWTVRRRFPHMTLQRHGCSWVRMRTMAGFGLGIQIACLCIALREPLFKVLIARSADLASVATFDIAFKLCTQLMSVIATPLLGLFGAAAFLSGRREDLAGLVRPLVGWTAGTLLPVATGLASFAQPLMQAWLGGDVVEAGFLLPVMCVGFSLYYATEALYKTIEGSGGTWYSAAIQVAVLLTQVGIYWFAAATHPYASAWSLAAGFLLFSLSNLVVFRARFSEIRLLTPRQWAALLTPTCAYAIGTAAVPSGAHPFLFAGYLAAHLTMLLTSGIVDATALRKRLMTTRIGVRRPVALLPRTTK